MTGPASRRALLGSIAALPALTVPAIAVASAPSDLTKLCDFAVQHGDWINRACATEGGWPDEKMAFEMRHYWDAFDQAAEQPSVGLREIQAKARLSLREMEDSGELENANPGLALAADVLREVIALCA